jgi:hypothetical protein
LKKSWLINSFVHVVLTLINKNLFIDPLSPAFTTTTNQAPIKINRDKHLATIARLEHLWQMPNHTTMLVNHAILDIIKTKQLDQNAKHVYPANGTIKTA